VYLNGNGMKYWVHKDMHEVRDEVTQGVQDAWKDTCIINLTGPERHFWMGIEAGMLGCSVVIGSGEWFLRVTDLITEAEWGQESFV
jgi:hypothetical protein